jgi:hypothetical protein
VQSLKLLRSVLVVGSFALASSGCIVVHDHDDGSSNPPPPPPDEDSEVIDHGQALTTDPGSGVAILVEYEGGTSWNIQTTCDTDKSGYSCPFDIYIRANSLTSTGGIELEGSDYIEQNADEIHAAFDTESDVDGITFQTGQNESVELEVYVDGNSAAPYVFWVGHNETHTGALSNPAIYIPN